MSALTVARVDMVTSPWTEMDFLVPPTLLFLYAVEETDVRE